MNKTSKKKKKATQIVYFMTKSADPDNWTYYDRKFRDLPKWK